MARTSFGTGWTDPRGIMGNSGHNDVNPLTRNSMTAVFGILDSLALPPEFQQLDDEAILALWVAKYGLSRIIDHNEVFSDLDDPLDNLTAFLLTRGYAMMTKLKHEPISGGVTLCDAVVLSPAGYRKLYGNT